jgi:hypothetical protein
VGDDRDYRFKLDYKPEGLGFSKAKVDILEATVPKALTADAKRLQMLLGAKKPELELLAHIDEKHGLVTLGAGARGLMSDWVRHLGTQRRVSAETDGGLALARRASAGSVAHEGCQLCIAIEPTRAMRMWLTHQRDFDANADAGTKLAEADALEATGLLGLSIRASGSEAALGVAGAPSLIFSDGAVIPALMRLGGWLPETLGPPEPRSDGG